MGIIYDTSSSKFEGSFDPYRYSGAIQYEKHFGNLMYLEFFATNPGSSFAEKRQAEAEMEVAKRKMNYWKRIADNQGENEQIKEAIQRIKKQWNR
jgi:hypothetical protein